MTVAAKDIYSGALTSTLTTPLYAAATSKGAVATSMSICNTTGATVNLTLKVNGVTRYAATPVPAGASWFVGPADMRWVIPNGATVTGGASTAAAIEISISGAEIS